jgi:hypothetical protein
MCIEALSSAPKCFETGVDYLHAVNANPDRLGFSFGILAAIFAILFAIGGVSFKVLISKKTN